MRIVSVNIPEGSLANGLKVIKMSRLGSVVLIAGRNGSGKSRLLEAVDGTLQKKHRGSEIESAARAHQHFLDTLPSLEKQLFNAEEAHKRVPESESKGRSQTAQRVTNARKNLDDVAKAIETQKEILSWDLIVTDGISEKYGAVTFVPKDLKLKDSGDLSKNELGKFAELSKKVGVHDLKNTTLATIQLIVDRQFNATHQYSKANESERQVAISEFDRLDSIIYSLLGTRLDRNLEGEALLFGFPVGKAGLSEGQKVLLQLSVALFAQAADLTDTILLLDEPENYLHPAALIEVIDRIRGIAKNGQLWIATHSAPLLAHFDPSFIWFMESGEIRHAGKIPEKVLSSLLGTDAEIAKLQEFVNLPALYASGSFAAQCLLPPEVVLTEQHDPQILQIREILKALASEAKLRVLDYGAGKGRLISNIAEQARDGEIEVSDWFDYVAYDSSEVNLDICKGSIELAYGSSDGRAFSTRPELLSRYDRGTFDLVVLCNVLHEIDPMDWLRLFGKDGEVSSLLREGGHMLLVEDYQMPIGELAYKNGFLVLDTVHLKELFRITEGDVNFKYVDERKDGRLKAHLIPKDCIVRITSESRLSAIRELKKSSTEEIRRLRSEQPNYRNGLRHGFWSQLLANCVLSLEHLAA